MSCTKDHKEGEDPKKKGPFSRLKESIDDKEEQLEILGTFIRLGVMVWAGFIIFFELYHFSRFSKRWWTQGHHFHSQRFYGMFGNFFGGCR